MIIENLAKQKHIQRLLEVDRYQNDRSVKKKITLKYKRILYVGIHPIEKVSWKYLNLKSFLYK